MHLVPAGEGLTVSEPVMSCGQTDWGPVGGLRSHHLMI